jgi:hypothetical protein
MCDDKAHIIINKVASDTGDALLGCYFQYVEERNELYIYEFFGKDGQPKIGGLHVGVQFNVSVGDKNFVLNIEGCTCERVQGKFTPGNTGDPDQAYQAQAGGTTVGEENAAAATV